MFGWLRRRRRQHAARPLPEALWQSTLARYPFLGRLSTPELARLRTLAGEFLGSKEFHGAQGFAITDEVAAAVAVQACLPVLYLGLDWYDDFVGIVIQPGEVVARRTVMDEQGVVHHYDEVLSGEAMDRGPVMLSWPDVADAGASADAGYNVVIHEFAHKIDMRDGLPDGCPPLPAGFLGAPSARAARSAWLAVMQREYEAFREKTIIAERFGGEPTWLDPYGAQSIDEFFAVACEAYFVNRERFAGEFAALLPLLDGFFKPNQP
ncbi:zinc-dependent peptidase [Variovorax terrae]|uniref:Zinc-dependent peptidase n=1 Tax=Variovorax terrae TaxID=2923278 RepID=A0A9X2AQ65_9BURK|nr:M90 family metallopeptidase [Variovorax terrae]MCJ0762816.1 zinc-dependent peptidase [Variovorax terrae]